jgi:hypothetical protein
MQCFLDEKFFNGPTRKNFLKEKISFGGNVNFCYIFSGFMFTASM